MNETLAGLRRLGLRVEETTDVVKSFLPNVWIDAGVLWVNPSAHVADIFHEAGHLAIVPSKFRMLVSGNLDIVDESPFQKVTEEYLSNSDLAAHPEDPTLRGLLQMGETEAVAWSYAAAVELKVDPLNLFTIPGAVNQPFQGEGLTLFAMLMTGNYMGVHGLQAAKMTTKKIWPKMLRWLQV